MIRPVLYVDLPGIVYALDRRARARHGEFANFVVAPDSVEPRSGVAALLNALWPITPTAHTWICEDRWHLLGLAQSWARPGALAWDLAYLAAMTAPAWQSPAIAPDDVLIELVQYVLDAAIARGVQRFFVRVGDEREELELFGKMSFQRYARELTYWLPEIPPQDIAAPATSLAGRVAAIGRLPRLHARDDHMTCEDCGMPTGGSLRPWHRHDAWGLLRLYDACTPRRVTVAESLTSDEFLHTRAGGGRTWHVPLVEPTSVAYVYDRGVRLAGWLRLRFGRGPQPHSLWVMAHPDEPDTALALVRLGLRVLAEDSQRSVVCQIREYEGTVIDALRAAGFEHVGSHALLVRHLTMRALLRREVSAVEPRGVYGVEGLGTAHTRLSKGEKTQYATSDH